MLNYLSEEQIQELDEKMSQFDKYVESQIELYINNDKQNIENGEYNYLVNESSLHDDIELSEDLQDNLDKSTLTIDQFINYCVEHNHFECSYEELSSPFQYGGQSENEICTIQWGGDRECTINQKDVMEFQPSFSLEKFSTLDEFKNYVSYHIGNLEYVETYWTFFKEKNDQKTVIYNTDYDLVRVSLKNEDDLINYLKENKKTIEKKEPIKATISSKEYKEYRRDNCGFCISCGHFSDGHHEPDATEYNCEKCEEPTSYGIEHAMIVGYVIIED